MPGTWLENSVKSVLATTKLYTHVKYVGVFIFKYMYIMHNKLSNF